MLEGLSFNWNIMQDICSRRHSPLTVDELLNLFDTKSFIFLQILFRAILRQICTGQQDQCTQIAEAMFCRNYSEVMRRLADTQAPSREELQAYNSTLIAEYERILKVHREHTQSNTHRSMAPPPHAQEQSRTSSKGSTRQAHHQTARPKHTSHGPQSASRDIPIINTRVGQRASSSSSNNPLLQPLSATTPHVSSNAGKNVPPRRSTSTAPSTSQMHATMPILRSTLVPKPTTFINSSPYPPGQVQQSNQSVSLSISQSTTPPFQTVDHQPRNNMILSSNVPSQDINSRHHQTQESHTIYPKPQAQSTPATSLLSGPSPQQPLQLQSDTQRPMSFSRNTPRSSMVSQQQAQWQRTLINSIPSLPPQSPQVHRGRQQSASRTKTAGSPEASTPHRSISLNTVTAPAYPNSSYSALHQAHLRSPIFSASEARGLTKEPKKYFRYIENVVMPPEALTKKKQHLRWKFTMNPTTVSLLAQARPSDRGAIPVRTVESGSRLCRVRCLKLVQSSGLPCQSDWVVADNVWPKSISILLNGIALEVRRKSHHLKDLPIDATAYLRSGENELAAAIIGLEEGDPSRYAVGVELIRVQEKVEIKKGISTLGIEEGRMRILKRSQQHDPDVEVIQAETIIDLKDPFSARQCTFPVRGSSCRHYQCFDLDTFLETRKSKAADQPCDPDGFRCPICGLDARPPQLIVDGFLLEVINTLQNLGASNVKAIILHDDGKWEIKKEDEGPEYSDDEMDRGIEGSLAEAQEKKARKARQSISREVIEID